MTHLPYVLSCYALGLAVPAGFGLAAWRRLRAVRRHLAAIDPRPLRSGHPRSGPPRSGQPR